MGYLVIAIEHEMLRIGLTFADDQFSTTIRNRLEETDVRMVTTYKTNAFHTKGLVSVIRGTFLAP